MENAVDGFQLICQVGIVNINYVIDRKHLVDGPAEDIGQGMLAGQRSTIGCGADFLAQQADQRFLIILRSFYIPCYSNMVF